jgi:serine/threonine protein kinase
LTLEEKLVFDLPCWNTISDSAKDLVTKLLQKDQKNRISLEEALAHKWFSSVRRVAHQTSK